MQRLTKLPFPIRSAIAFCEGYCDRGKSIEILGEVKERLEYCLEAYKPTVRIGNAAISVSTEEVIPEDVFDELSRWFSNDARYMTNGERHIFFVRPFVTVQA
jgi:hypothetical protein